MSNEQSLLFSPVGTCQCTGYDFQLRDTISLSDILKWVVFLHREWSKRLTMSGLHVWYHQFSREILIHDVSLKCFL